MKGAALHAYNQAQSAHQDREDASAVYLAVYSTIQLDSTLPE